MTSRFPGQLVADFPKVLFVSSFPPRQCGIATFTEDLLQAVASEIGPETPAVIAMNSDDGKVFSYPPSVAFEIRRNWLSDYREAAEYINLSRTSLVNLQHEFGLFGGPGGSYLSSLLENLKKPVISTLHTVCEELDSDYRPAFMEVVTRSQRLVVMSERARRCLLEVYEIPPEKVVVIPHGVPDVPFVDPEFSKTQINLEGRFVILTFGLLSPVKGIETMIEALPPIVERHPEVLYVVLGATHPEVKKVQGEQYRLSLARKVRDLGLHDNVVFHNRFVTLPELCDYICASDLYVSPTLSREQITSGTLSYALGMGKAIISTPSVYAQELLADNRGVLAEFGDASSFTRSILELIENPSWRNRICRKSYDHGRKMVWREVGRQYLEVFGQVLREGKPTVDGRPRPKLPAKPTLPEVRWDALLLLFDDVGPIQHASFGVPDRNHGYSSDDAGRSLVVLSKLYRHEPNLQLLRMITTSLSFLGHAQTQSGAFHDFMSYDRTFRDQHKGEDTLGRCVWGLGSVVENAPNPAMRAFAQNMIEKAQGQLGKLISPRAKAYSICGLCPVLQHYEGAIAYRRLAEKLGEELADQFFQNRKPGWDWLEDILTYGSAKISEALLLAYQISKTPKLLEAGLASLEFLTQNTWNGHFFDMVGNEGWFKVGGTKAIFGQQPIEAGYLTEAYVRAFNLTGELRYFELAQQAFEWFLGRNRLGMPLYDFASGGVADGLDAHGLSVNQGTESVICYLLGLLALTQLHSERAAADHLQPLTRVVA